MLAAQIFPKTIVSRREFPPSLFAAVDAHAGAFAGGVEARDARLAPGVRVDAAHGIVLARHDGDRLVDGVDAGEVYRYPPYPRESLQDLLRPEMPQVEVHVFAQLVLEGVAGLDLRLDAPRHDVAGRKLHGLRHVPLHEALALVVDEVGPFPPAGLRS